MMLASLAEAARVLDRRLIITPLPSNRPTFCSRTLVRPMVGCFARIKAGVTNPLNAYLEDYACLIDGLLELYQTTFDERYFLEARAWPIPSWNISPRTMAASSIQPTITKPSSPARATCKITLSHRAMP